MAIQRLKRASKLSRVHTWSLRGIEWIAAVHDSSWQTGLLAEKPLIRYVQLRESDDSIDIAIQNYAEVSSFYVHMFRSRGVQVADFDRTPSRILVASSPWIVKLINWFETTRCHIISDGDIVCF